MKKVLLLISIIALTFSGQVAAEEYRAHTPKVGSQERKNIMDALRKELKINSQFDVYYLKAKNNSAYFAGKVVPSDEQNKYAMGSVRALVEKQDNGRWKVVDIWTLANETASAEQRMAFNERVRKKLKAEGTLEIILDENL